MKFVLAPLAGFTDGPFRRMCYEGGADLCYTEMVSAPGLAHGNEPTRELLELMPGEGPVACQLFGAEESDLAKACGILQKTAGQIFDRNGCSSDHRTIGPSDHQTIGASDSVRMVESSQLLNFSTSQLRFTELNLNAGCPMTKVTKCGAGAKLIEDPAKVYRLLKAMTENTDLPVTLKTRLGPHPQKTVIFELLDAAEQAGAKGLIVHARYTSQMHGGEVHLEVLKEVVERAKIPITGNGSVVDVATAKAMAKTGVAAIMIGRAALNNPAIFSFVKNGLSASQLHNFTTSQLLNSHLAYILEFRKLLATKYAHVPSEDGYASVKMHTHLFRYFNGRPGAAKLRARLNQVRTLAEIKEIIESCAGC